MKKILFLIVGLALMLTVVSCSHTHSYELTERIEPTCTEKGFVKYTCTECGAEKIDEIRFLSHDMGGFVTLKEAGHYEAGLKERKCLNCDYTEREYIEAEGLQLVEFREENSTQITHYGIRVKTPLRMQSDREDVVCECEECNENTILNIPTEYLGHPITEFCGIVSAGIDDTGYFTVVNVPASIEIIGEYAFYENKSIVEIKFDHLYSCLTTIGASAFYRSSIQSISLPNSVKKIDNGAFSDCYSLKEISLSGSLQYIGDNAFSDCYSLKEISLSGSLQYIGDNAFSNCYSLKEISLPDSLEHIGNYVFFHCESLAEINIPASVSSIGIYVFEGCDKLEYINVNENNEYYTDDHGVLYNKDQTQLIAYPYGSTNDTFTIPNTVTHICGGAVVGLLLETVYIPDSVISIEQGGIGRVSTIYCEAESKPEGWDIGWYWNVESIVWGYTGE